MTGMAPFGAPDPSRHGRRPDLLNTSRRRTSSALDFELSIANGLRLLDQLAQTLFGHRIVALFVNVNSVNRAWRLSIDQHASMPSRLGWWY
jgi:hypothetical protein